MSPEFIAIIVGFVTLLISILGTFMQLSDRIDKLDNKQDGNFKTLLGRIDAVNSRLDNLYHELFKKKSA